MIESPINNHKIQKEVWLHPARFKVLVAGRRSGKTVFAREWLLRGSCFNQTNNCYVAPTRHQAKEIIWEDLKARLHELKWTCKIHESDLTIRRQNGSVISLRSAERPERFRGKKHHRIVLDEFSEYKDKKIWSQVIRPTLSDTGGQGVFCFTPKGFNHAYELCQIVKNKMDWQIFKFRTCDSPFFQTPEGIAELKAAKELLSEKDYKQEYEASFEAYTGRIFYSFCREKCNTDYKFNKDNGTIFIGQDFNRSPMCSALYQKVSGKFIQFGEIFITSGDTDATCRAVRERFGNHHAVFIPDASGARRTSNSSSSDFDMIKSYGFEINAHRANPRRVDRWASVNRCYEKGIVLVNVAECPYTVKDREMMTYKEGSCEANITSPMMGHMADAADYAIEVMYPIIEVKPARTGYYA